MQWDSITKAYEKFDTGLQVFPGMWRPRAQWEQVSWVSCPWPQSGYVWLDFPEVIIINDEYFAYAGHGPIGCPEVNHAVLPQVPWEKVDGQEGIKFERELPEDNIIFGGSVIKKDQMTVDLGIYLRNTGNSSITDISLQTCAFLKMTTDFSENTNENKYVHVKDKGWMNISEAVKLDIDHASYRIGWRKGKACSDLPYIVTESEDKKRLLVMTWFDDTYSFIGNPQHPCMHADPAIAELAPGQHKELKGRLQFIDGNINDDFLKKIS